ncbi:hypothetical protein QTI51_17490 [Variovorax sp. J22G73]|uniref:hypothetical protein n=1 Tax=unclassified Variovorax TaxID=663243 RepID=UPI0025783141|nr:MULTISPECIES: hypothetical protein [unclassified Variovorax]MDM0007164.1 hypothetical protein [Variovorax sp. J22R203]MDM0099084.1 hypothetical protein [Variovorax sp. J22G73]
MIKFEGQKVSAFVFDGHEHVCDLIEADGPLLSLYTDLRDNWLYLWCDTDRVKVNRWMLIKAPRTSLVEFFSQRISLRALIENSPSVIMLDETAVRSEKVDDLGIPQEPTISLKRRFIKLDDPTDVQAYWPSDRSFFNPELAEGIDIRQEFAPSKHLIPVDGRWYFKDLDSFSRTYAKLYAFLYSTKPQFINSMSARLYSLLRAPWTGGYSRVNLFSSLRRGLPALHDLQIDSFSYASPGAIEVEALPSICEDVSRIILSSKGRWPRLAVYDKIINTIIGKHKLRKVDLSTVPNEQLPFAQEEAQALENSCTEICTLLGVEDRIDALRDAAPNLIVYAKAVQALLGQVQKLNAFQEQGLLNLGKSQDQAEADIRDSAARNIVQ